MNSKTKFLFAAGALAASMAVAPIDAQAAKEGFEKCYGVAKAGHNDCASKDGSHSCAGQSKEDGDANEWIYLPEGTCDKIAGGQKG